MTSPETPTPDEVAALKAHLAKLLAEADLPEHWRDNRFVAASHAITMKLAEGLDAIWRRPDAPRLADLYLKGLLTLRFTRDGVGFEGIREEAAPDPLRDGGTYL